MDKIKINNQIVSLRKFVKQSKVRILNKLAKDVKQFQNKKGNESQLEKFKRKAEKLLAEIEIIKKILPDTVSKMVLVKEKDWKGILTNKDATLHDRSLAMIANYDEIQNEVEKFHEANPHMVKKIPRLLREWEKRKNEVQNQSSTKKVKASEIRQNKKARTKMGVNRKSTSKNFSPGNNTINSPIKDTEKNKYLTNDSKITTERIGIKNFRSKSNFNEPENEFAINCYSDSEFAVDSDSKREFAVDSDSKREFAVHRNSESESAADNDSENELAADSYSDMELTSTHHAEHDSKLTCADTLGSGKNLKSIKTLNLEELVGLDEIPIEDESIEEDFNTVSSELKKDPFFLGKNSASCSSDEKSSHERVPKLNRKNSTQHSHKSFRERGKFGSQMHRGEKKQFFEKTYDGSQKGFGRGKPNFRNNFSTRHGSSSFKKNFNQNSFSKQDKFDKNKTEEKPLHPSWEAKRKLKESQSVSSAKAKRVVF